MAVGSVKSWYRIRAARKSAEIRIYEEIGAWGVTSKQFAEDLAALGNLETLSIRINSPGGDVFEALAIHNALQRHPARVTVRIDALCASAASLIALAGDETRMVENGQYMIHEPWTVAFGDSADLQRNADLLDSIAQQIVTLYARKTGLEPDDIRERMKSETWMTAAEALDAGFIDAVDEPLRIAAKIHDLSRFQHPPRNAMTDETETPTTDELSFTPSPPASEVVTPIEPSAENANPSPLEASAIARACLEADEPNLIPLLLAGPVTAADLRARIENAAELRCLCAIARQPERADECIAAGLTPDQAKLRLWDAIVARDRAVGEIDATPPVACRKTTADPSQIARAALGYQQAQQAAGLPVSFAEAVAHITQTGVPA